MDGYVHARSQGRRARPVEAMRRGVPIRRVELGRDEVRGGRHYAMPRHASCLLACLIKAARGAGSAYHISPFRGSFIYARATRSLHEAGTPYTQRTPGAASQGPPAGPPGRWLLPQGSSLGKKKGAGVGWVGRARPPPPADQKVARGAIATAAR
eukprot:scaffold1481_cov401-Prasinococcus_capsulatus_cf.AAC.13